ncbi:hypothetical protein EDD27_1484 [Nonomuraea polychroma]|uniref:Uncharacterized protein n=1 Tax=Nonomuraea polychroma TaxID=46176 RepID=A0A438M0Y1_9ACTN|nr:hypothetical protein [Nonomuraea polychroma]RVX39138.1 hypothetical protein EDD27_1484 [Nonomuraea polychroma]
MIIWVAWRDSAAARDELPVDAREAAVRLFAMQRVIRLRLEHNGEPAEPTDAVLAMRKALEAAVEEFINLSRKARGMRAPYQAARPPTLEPGTGAGPQLPGTAREWTAHLAEFTHQLEADGKLAYEHWHHRRLYDALVHAVAALGQAHPGGLDRLPRPWRRRQGARARADRHAGMRKEFDHHRIAAHDHGARAAKADSSFRLQ